jgi:hypothetical protein
MTGVSFRKTARFGEQEIGRLTPVIARRDAMASIRILAIKHSL